MPTEEWIIKAKQLGKITDQDRPEVILSCYQIFGEDFGTKVPRLNLGNTSYQLVGSTLQLELMEITK